MAERFYRKHGFLAPGKDDPLRTEEQEKQAHKIWGPFWREDRAARAASIRAVLAKARGGA